MLLTHRPTELYNLASISSIPECWKRSLAVQVNGVAPLKIMDTILKVSPATKFFQASSREIFGDYPQPMDENTPYSVKNTYGAAKLYAHNMVKLYRNKYNIYACSGILFNHESPRRGKEFVTKKITSFAAKCERGDRLKLGDLSAERDWGYAKDFVKAMWLMLQQDKPDDYVISTGELNSVGDICEIAFSHLGLNYEDYVVTDPEFVRRNDIRAPIGNSTKASRELGWQPTITFEEMIKSMVRYDHEEYLCLLRGK